MPKALTRDELQAQTRALIISAAERVFLARGYNATTIAQIAEEAGRTHGSIYGNFAGKEDLCLQVLRGHFEHVLGDLSTDVLAADGQIAALSATQQQWEKLLEQPSWIRLAADFMIATRSDPDQEPSNRATLDAFTTGIRMLILVQAAALGVQTVDPEVLQHAAAALLATGIGLAVGHALGATTREIAVASFIETVELWFRRMEIDPHSPGGPAIA
jgi:AcrR family transcriptional regulator